MKAIDTLKAALVATAFAALVAAEAQAQSAPDYVRVRSISYAGTGCPAGTVATNISPDRQGLRILFDQFIAEVGPGVPFNQKRKNCQLNIDLDFPSGWSYTVRTMDHQGYVALERGVKATQAVSYYFQGQSATARLSTKFTGPIDQDYQIRDTLGSSAEVWSPCGAQRALNINTQVNLNNSGASHKHGIITVERGDGAFPSGLGGLGLAWRRCQ